jgi:hypothetical protein
MAEAVVCSNPSASEGGKGKQLHQSGQEKQEGNIVAQPKPPRKAHVDQRNGNLLVVGVGKYWAVLIF